MPMMDSSPRLLGTLRREDGSLTILSLFFFLVMVTMCGFAVDLIVHEKNRAKIQGVLDTAVLAAASATQENVDRDEVIYQYAEKSGLPRDIVNVKTQSGDGDSSALVHIEYKTPTMFAHMMGLDDLTSVSLAYAEERVTAVEISLVLDFTSSMKGARRTTLIDAVDDFLNVVYQIECDNLGNCTEPDPENDTVINVVPYGGTVNPGQLMASTMGLQRWHDYSSCGVIPTAAYSDSELPYGASKQMPHFYTWNRANLTKNQEFGWCPQSENAILYAADHPQQIKDYIRTLNLNDGTGTDIGMKWGLALVDPSSRDEINMVNATPTGTFPQDHAKNVLKVVVVMTDGGITFQTTPIDDIDGYGEYQFDYDHVYDEDGNLREEDDLEFQAERAAILGRYGSCVPEDGDGVYDSDYYDYYYAECDDFIEDHVRPRADVEQNVANKYRKASRNSANVSISTDDAIAQFSEQCDLARIGKTGTSSYEEKVTVYTVRLLESREWTREYLETCATRPYQFFDVTSLNDLEGAFSSIAGHINNKKLSLVN